MTKKIAFVLESFTIGGVTEVVKNIFESLEQQDYQIELILLSKNTNQPQLPNINYTYFDIEEDPNYSLIRYMQYALFKSITLIRYRKVVDFINELNPDIIHFHTNPRQLVFSHLINKHLSNKLLFTDHSVRLNSQDSTWLKIKLLSMVYKHYYKYLNVTAVSLTAFNSHRKNNLISKNKKHYLIENKIKPMSSHSNIGIKDNIIRFIYIARLHPNKGHDVLVKAWSNVNSNVERELLLIGPNSMGLKTKDSSIKILGSLPKPEVEAWIQKSNFGVFPSKKEGLPLALIEMLSAGLPVIVNDIPELTSVVKDDYNGLVYRKNDVIDLARKINYVLDNSTKRQLLSANATSSASMHCSNDPGKPYLKIYESIL